MEKNLAGADRSRWTILFVMVLGTFMATLDSSIVNVALPSMADALHVTSESIAWVVSAYLIAISASILIFGKLGDQIGLTAVFQFGLVIFTAGSFLCSITDSFSMLIVARVVQAVGAAGTMANSQGIITHTFPDAERGRALGINGTFVALGALAGPPLGGLIISFASWQYMFWINVPIGIIAFILGMKVYPRRTEKRKAVIDIPGSLLFVLAIVPLFVALDQSITMGFANALIIGCLIASAVGFVLFYHVEKRSEKPLLPFFIFRNKWFTVSVFCAFLSFVAIFFPTIIQPFYLQELLGLSPGLAGLFLSIYPIAMAISAPLSGNLADRIGSEIITVIGLSITGLGLFLMSLLDAHPNFIAMGIIFGLSGLGNGMFQSPNTKMVMSSIDRKYFGTGGSVNALVRNVGMVVGITVATMILYGGMGARLGHVVNNYDPAQAGQNDAFLFGMRLAYIVAALVCALGVAVTVARMHSRRKEKREAQ